MEIWWWYSPVVGQAMSEGLRQGKRKSESPENMISSEKCMCREEGDDTKNKCRSIGVETTIEPFPQGKRQSSRL